MIESNRKRRPPPISISKIEGRQDGEENSPRASDKKTLPPFTTPTQTDTPREGGHASIVWLPNIATSSRFSPGRIRSTQAPAQSTSSLGLAKYTQLSTYTSRPSITSSTSPTATQFITVIQPVTSLKQEQNSPSPTRTVFNSGLPQVVTVTAVAQAPSLLADNSRLPKTTRESAIPLGAVKPLIALGVIASVSVVVIVAVILWRRRRKKNEAVIKETADQPPMAGMRDNGLRMSEDMRPILA